VVLLQAGAVRRAEFIRACSIFPSGAGEGVHIGRRAAHIGYDPGKILHPHQHLHLSQYGLLAAALHNPALMVGQGAERAGAKAPPVAGDGEAHRLESGYSLPVGGMGRPLIGQLIYPVQFFAAERPGGWILNYDRFGVGLDHPAAMKGILLLIVQSKGPGVLPPVSGNLSESRNLQFILALGPAFPSGHLLLDCSAGHISDLRDPLFLLQPPGYLSQGSLPHAVDDHIRRGIGQDRLPHRVRPVVVMGKATQAGLDPS